MNILTSRFVMVTVVGLLSAVVVSANRRIRADDIWTAQRILDALEAREEAISTIDAVVRKDDRLGEGWEQYRIDREAYRAAVARFLEVKRSPQPPPRTRPIIDPPFEYWRYRRNRLGETRVDWLQEWDDGCGDEPAFSKAVCFDGRVFQEFMPGEEVGPQVILDSFMHMPLVAQALGIGGPLWAFGKAPWPKDARISLSQYLQEAFASERVLGPKAVKDPKFGQVVELVIRHPMDKEYPDAVRPVCLEVIVLLDPARGLAPVKVSAAGAGRKENGDWEAKHGSAFSGVWDDYVQTVPGVWLAKTFQLRRYVTLRLPKSGKDFRPELKGGKQVYKKGIPLIDFSATKIVTHCIGQSTFNVLDLRVNEDLDEAFCHPEFPAGTIVHDRRTQELFQLTGVSPAVDATLREALDIATGVPLTGPPGMAEGSRTGRVIVIGNLAFLAVVLGTLWFWRRYRRARR